MEGQRSNDDEGLEERRLIVWASEEKIFLRGSERLAGEREERGVCYVGC